MDPKNPGAGAASLPGAPPAEAGAGAPTLIRLTGRDSLALLHRISTQALADLAPGRTRMTLFCDFRARLLHRAAVAVTSDGAVWLVRHDAPGQELIEYLDRQVFRDDVRLANAASGWRVRAVTGGFGAEPGALAEREAMPDRLQIDADFGLEVVAWDADPAVAESEIERIRAGRPRHGREIHADFSPFEVGLACEVHLDKGCFTGQETLLRLVTYGGVRRRLARVVGPGAAPASPCDLLLGHEPVGRLTSAAPDQRGWLGLAVVQPAALEPGAQLEADGALIESAIGFPETRPLGWR